MLLVIGAAGGLLAGLLARGSPRALGGLRFRAAWVIPVALVVKEAGVFTPLAGSWLAPILYTLSLAALVAWAIWNRDQLPALSVVAAGMALNLAVVLANSGRMPVDPALAGIGPHQLLDQGTFGQYTLAGAATRLNGLGDRIGLPGGLGRALPFAYSPGDLVAFAGMGLSGFQATRWRNPQEA